MKTVLLIFICILLASFSFAQKNGPSFYNKEFRVITDNDAYMLRRKDGYYTNGIFLQYNWTGRSEKKKINSIEIGQRMYTSRTHFMHNLSEYDRPFAGYLFAKYQQTGFSAKQSVVRWSISAGTIGPNAFAKEVQTKYHRLIHIYKTYGWDVQVTNEIELNGSLSWSSVVAETKHFAFKPFVTGNLGTTFTNAEIGSLFQFGWFEKNENSAQWNASLQSRPSSAKRNFELFFFFQPELIATAYNATVQGPVFRQHKGLFTASVYPLQYRHRLGVLYSHNRMSAGLDAVFQTKEAKTQQVSQRYGTIHVGYRFR